jgi:hypothetical protein
MHLESFVGQGALDWRHDVVFLHTLGNPPNRTTAAIYVGFESDDYSSSLEMSMHAALNRPLPEGVDFLAYFLKSTGLAPIDCVWDSPATDEPTKTTITIAAAKPDSHDAAKFHIKFTLNAAPGEIEGRLAGDGKIHFSMLSGPNFHWTQDYDYKLLDWQSCTSKMPAVFRMMNEFLNEENRYGISIEWTHH